MVPPTAQLNEWELREHRAHILCGNPRKGKAVGVGAVVKRGIRCGCELKLQFIPLHVFVRAIFSKVNENRE